MERRTRSKPRQLSLRNPGSFQFQRAHHPCMNTEKAEMAPRSRTRPAGSYFLGCSRYSRNVRIGNVFVFWLLIRYSARVEIRVPLTTQACGTRPTTFCVRAEARSSSGSHFAGPSPARCETSARSGTTGARSPSCLKSVPSQGPGSHRRRERTESGRNREAQSHSEEPTKLPRNKTVVSPSSARGAGFVMTEQAQGQIASEGHQREAHQFRSSVDGGRTAESPTSHSRYGLQSLLRALPRSSRRLFASVDRASPTASKASEIRDAPRRVSSCRVLPRGERSRVP